MTKHQSWHAQLLLIASIVWLFLHSVSSAITLGMMTQVMDNSSFMTTLEASTVDKTDCVKVKFVEITGWMFNLIDSIFGVRQESAFDLWEKWVDKAVY